MAHRSPALFEMLESRTLMSVTPVEAASAAPETAPAIEMAAARRKAATPPNVVGTYSGSVGGRGVSEAFTLNILSQDAAGGFTGTIAFTTGGGETSTPVSGSVRGRKIRFAGFFGESAVAGRGRIAKDGQGISGNLVQEVMVDGRRRPAKLRSLMTLTRPPLVRESVPAETGEPEVVTPVEPCGCGSGDSAA